MMARLEMPTSIWMLVQELENAGYETWAVGGCVRDGLLGQLPHDWDLTTAARPETMLALLPQAIPTGLAHGTVTVPTQAGPIEVTTFRAETGYADHRRPDAVEFLTQIEGDLARRDFTVNAMAWHPGRGLCDPFDGQGDLQRRVLRCVGDPDCRFREDALRMLRAVRFAARLGFEIEPRTAAALDRHSHEVGYVAHERIFAELGGILGAGGAGLAQGYPELLRTACQRLPLPASRHAMRTWRSQLGDENAAQLLRWCSVYGQQDTQKAAALLEQLQKEQTRIKPDIDGQALMALGIPPGPEMGQVFKMLRAAIEAGAVENRREQLIAWLRRP